LPTKEDYVKSHTLGRTRTTVSSLSNDEFLTTQELMQLLKIKHKQTIYNLIRDGMPAISVGKNYRFIKAEVVEFLRELSRNESHRKG